MSNCRKCGARNITRRSAGVFVCRRCGVQPGPFKLDRFGNAAPRPAIEPDLQTPSTYKVATRQPRLLASYKVGEN